ncbi:PAS domain-containing protein [Hymenobacter sediminis]|uniref:PAS domain-containing sensor histidine kinase n=1 Tax=Hymenobacter sediminis TaxID=2218621 RepID=UPI000DA659CA|nr:PAS domain-containing sensor histidine kinase [Hymenobacter sediminis]RPD44861.1 PAS domain-containing protein [Hymenobacter sediminis]
MPTSTVQATQPSDLPTWLPADELLCEVLNVSMTGLIFYTPVYGPSGSGEIVDFTFVHLNPAAQRMMRMPSHPTLTHMQQWPHSKEHGTFGFHVDAYVTGEPRSYDINYQADGYDNYYRLTARRAGEGLLVSFTDTADQTRTPVEIALRESQAREQAALAEAKAQRQQLQEVFHQAPVAIGLMEGPDYRIALVNPSICELWDREESQLLNVPLLEALPELQGQGIDELLNRVLQTGEPFVGKELPFQVKRHGHLDTIYFNFVYQPQRNGQGATTGVLVVAIDVTDQVLARQQVQQLNQQLEVRVAERTREALALQSDLLEATQRQVRERETFYQIFAQTPASIALLRGPEHQFTYVNAAYEALFPGRVLVGRNLADVLPDAAQQGFLALLDTVYRTGETFFGTELPLTIAQPDGRPPREAYFTFTYQAYRERGEVVGISIFAYDVAEQVRARRQREGLQRQLHELFMQAPAPIAILDGPDLVYQLVNPAYQLMFPGRDLAGKPLLEALTELVDTPIPTLLQDVYRTGETYVAQELPLMLARHTGAPLEEIYWTFTYQARRSMQGEIDGVLVFAYDVTAQVQARKVVEESGQQALSWAAELAASNAQLTRTNVDLDNFIYTASHDLREPITNLEGLVLALEEQLQQTPIQDPLVPALLVMIQDAVARFQVTIAQLTNLAQLQQAQLQPAEEIDVAALVESVRLDLAPKLVAAGVQLEVSVTLTSALSFAPKHLRSIVYNLLSNAVKYRHPDRPPLIQLRCYRANDTVVLEVEDNGLGLDEEKQTRLFGLFQRLHDHVEGSGIGLYMVKRIVENAGGTITVQSQAEVGSLFRVALPA